MSIGQKIRNLRISQGLSVEELAEKLGKNRATVYRYENGDIKDLPSTVLEPLAKILCTTPADLMGYSTGDSISVDKLNDNELRLSQLEAQLLDGYRKLNDSGKQEMHKRLRELLQLPDYSEEKSLQSDAG